MSAGDYSEVRTDGTRVAWRDDTKLKTALLTNPAAALVLTDNYKGLVFVKDGVVGWLGTDPAVGINDGSSTTALSDGSGVFDPYPFVDGHLVFYGGRGLFSWSSAAGKQRLLDAFRPTLHTQGVAYLLTGEAGALYRTTLP